MIHLRFIFPGTIGAAMLLACVLPTLSVAGVSYEPFLGTGQVVTDLNGNWAGTFTVTGGRINDNGVIFAGGTFQLGNNRYSGYVTGSPGNLKLITDTQGHLPGLASDVTILSFDRTLFDNNGGVTMYVTYDGYNVRGQGVWRYENGSLYPVIYTGQPLPDAMGQMAYTFNLGSVQVNRTGQVLISTYVGYPMGDGLWSYSDRQLKYVACEHGDASFAGPGAYFYELLRGHQNMDSHGRIYANAGITIPGVEDKKAILTFEGGMVTADYLHGDLLDVNSAGTKLINYDQLSHRSIATVSSTGVVNTLINQGDPAPGVPGDSPVFEDITQTLTVAAINETGSVVIGPVRVSSSTYYGEAIYRHDSGGLHLLALSDQTLPGLPSDASISSFEYYGISASINSRGTILLPVIYETSQSSFNRALYAFSSQGEVVPLAVPGMHIELAPGDIRTISTVYISYGAGTPSPSGGDDASQWLINNNDQIVCSMTFTDGITMPVVITVPEPLTAMSLAAGAFLILRRRR